MTLLTNKTFLYVIAVLSMVILYIGLYKSYQSVKNQVQKMKENKLAQIEKFTLENNDELKSCNYTEQSFAYPVMSPNIPDDPQTKTHIGYDVNKYLGLMGSLTGTNTSEVRVIKPLLKYDGIYRSDVSGTKEVETQKWKMNLNPMSAEGTYGSDKLLPPKNFPF